MSIKNSIRVIQRIEVIVNDLIPRYGQPAEALQELKKLKSSLQDLNNYLMNLESIKPNYETNSVNDFIKAIDLHLDLLKELIAAQDYKRLANGVKVLKAFLQFHPTKYSPITFMYAWLLEWLYFL